jgi:hypothetical protein
MDGRTVMSIEGLLKTFVAVFKWQFQSKTLNKTNKDDPIVSRMNASNDLTI